MTYASTISKLEDLESALKVKEEADKEKESEEEIDK